MASESLRASGANGLGPGVLRTQSGDPKVLADRLPPSPWSGGLCSTGHVCGHTCVPAVTCLASTACSPGHVHIRPVGVGFGQHGPWVATAHACPRHVHSVLCREEAAGSLPWAGGKRSSDLVSGGVSLPHALLHRLPGAPPPRPLGLSLLSSLPAPRGGRPRAETQERACARCTRPGGEPGLPSVPSAVC